MNMINSIISSITSTSPTRQCAWVGRSSRRSWIRSDGTIRSSWRRTARNRACTGRSTQRYNENRLDELAEGGISIWRKEADGSFREVPNVHLVLDKKLYGLDVSQAQLANQRDEATPLNEYDLAVTVTDRRDPHVPAPDGMLRFRLRKRRNDHAAVCGGLHLARGRYELPLVSKTNRRLTAPSCRRARSTISIRRF